ncbi:acetylcholine receptor subunit alpha-like [Littorina saxatilis]|uniref:Uncharacterized protein n=1 Tax=Littorina saxatilis TaxID=31220 RepID=A0AAN9AZI3_9CAEN
MSCFLCVTCLGVFWGLLSRTGSVAGSPEMQALRQRLLSNYSGHVRPVLREESVVHINVSMYLLFILDLDLKAQTLKSSGYMDVVWKDEYLVWEPAEYANITDLLLPQTTIWLPDLIVSNDVRSLNFFGTDRTQAHLRYDGTVTWQPDFLRETGCNVDIFKYPFDSQVCGLRVVSWMMTGQYMSVTYDTLHMDTVVTNGEFLLTDTRTEQTTLDVSYSPVKVTQGSFIVVLQRRYSFYLLSTVVPLAAFSLLSPLALLVPADSGEKITLSVTVLLTNIVFMGTLSDSMPRVSDTVSVFVLYASLQIILSFTAVIVNVVALCISRLPTTINDFRHHHHHHPHQDGEHNGKPTEAANNNDTNYRKLRRLYIDLFHPSAKAGDLKHHFQGSPPLKRGHNRDDRGEVTATDAVGQDVADDSQRKESDRRPSACPEEEEERGGGWVQSAPIGRRDRLCFLTMFLVVVCVNVVTIVILVM